LAGRGVDARDELVDEVRMLGIDRDRRLPVALALRVDVQAGWALVVESGGGRRGVHHNRADGEQGRKDGQSEGSNAHWWPPESRCPRVAGPVVDPEQGADVKGLEK